jgi:predicted GNAT family N-acyltransferase
MKSFKEFINENQVDSVLNVYRSNIDFFVSENTISITLHKIVVEEKKGGLGTKFMNTLISYADSAGKRVELDPSTDFGGTSKSRLIKFYKKFGFVENKGRNKDYEISHSMYRNPK